MDYRIQHTIINYKFCDQIIKDKLYCIMHEQIRGYNLFHIPQSVIELIELQYIDTFSSSVY